MSVLDKFKMVDILNTRTNAVLTFERNNILRFNCAAFMDLNYPSHIQVYIDEKGKNLAIKACKESDPNAIKFSRPQGEQIHPIKFMCIPVSRIVRKLMEWDEEEGWNAQGALFLDEGTIIFSLEKASPIVRRGSSSQKKDE